MRDAQRVHRLIDRSAPEHQRTFERQLAVECERVVGEGKPWPFDPAAFLTQQSGREADQARLAATVGTGDLETRAGAKLQIQAFEQQPPAAPQRHAVKAQQRAHSMLSSSACMSSSEKPKW